MGFFPGLAPTERVPMPTIPQRIASAFAVFFGHYGDVSRMAQDREQSRQSLYREANPQTSVIFFLARTEFREKARKPPQKLQ